MAEIRILDSETVNRIAAGEVVAGPASVVKELVENSLDAGATRIEIDLEAGGSRLIRVVDDGCGMDETNALLALERHATSKLVSASDLFALTTMGFRGEALPSIAAVSKLTLVTRPREADAATLVEVHGGRIQKVERAAARPGTRIEVRHLFFNTPARKKFMKSQGAETAAVRELVADCVLVRPDVAFRLTSNGATLLAAAGALTPREALERVLEPGEVEHFLELPAATHPELPYTVRGFVTRPSLTRATSRGIRTFVNRRPFYSPHLCRGLLEAYRNFVPKREWPAAVLEVEADPRAVDVNVHPAKKEVRFTGYDKLQAWLIDRVRGALERELGPRPIEARMEELADRGEFPVPGAASPPPGPPDGPAPGPARGWSPLAGPPPGAAPHRITPAESRAALALFDPRALGPSRHEVPGLTGPAAAGAALAPGARLFPQGVRVLGQVFDSFILAADDAQVYYVDQHVAHERILFEKIGDALRSGTPEVQPLLVPLELAVPSGDLGLLADTLDRIEKHGFRVRVAEGRAWLEAVPLTPRPLPVTRVLKEMVESLCEAATGDRLTEAWESMADSMSCKAAVKAGDRLTPGELDSLLTQLARCRYPLTCPHGRPVLMTVSEEELRRRFLRSG